MKRNSLWKRLTAAVLSLTLVLSLSLTAGAAPTDPKAYLRSGAYRGQVSRCVMDHSMAMAYAEALKTLPSNGKAILIDPAGDGMPLLVTTYSNDPWGYDLEGNLKIWTWNGQRAAAYNFAGDLEFGHTFGYTLGTYQGQSVLWVGDGCSVAVGGAAGDLYYKVQDAQLSLIRHVMHYSAYSMDGTTAYGTTLPLVRATKDEYGRIMASVADLIRAGWYHDSSNSYFVLDKVDGNYLFFTSEEEANSWWESERNAFSWGAYNEQFIEVTTGSVELVGTWSTVSDMKTALTGYAKAYAAATGGFVDVGKSHYAYEPVAWAVEKKITNGTSDATFSPDRTCTQGQILTFLWRAMGEPNPSGSNPFTNSAVVIGQYYYKALLWAYEQGIVTDKSLDPNGACKRSDVVLYLWRMAGSPAAGGAAFSDVSPSAPYAQAVAWAVKAGITKGTSTTTFSPNQICTRGQIVTFLYRDLA